jgi:cell division protein FtsL
LKELSINNSFLSPYILFDSRFSKLEKLVMTSDITMSEETLLSIQSLSLTLKYLDLQYNIHNLITQV